jgi:heme/copper-type cytochrome/quinol oxidase subunit 2
MILPSLSLIADDEIDHKGSLYTVGVLGNQWYWNYELNLAVGVIKYVSNLVSDPDILKLDSNLTGAIFYGELYRLLNVLESLPIVVGIKTSFYITSNDVNHSFAIPALGIKVDAIPGRINLKTIIASRLGMYSGMCSELCGTDHGFMPISVKVLTFSEWWYNIKYSLEEVKSKQIFDLYDIWFVH